MKLKTILILLTAFLSVFIVSESYATWYIYANQKEDLTDVDNSLNSDYHNVYIQYVTTKMSDPVETSRSVINNYTISDRTITDSISGTTYSSNADATKTIYDKIISSIGGTVGSGKANTQWLVSLKSITWTTGSAKTAVIGGPRTTSADGNTITYYEDIYNFTLAATVSFLGTAYYGFTGSITRVYYTQEITRSEDRNSDGTISVQKTYKIKDGEVFNRPNLIRENVENFGFTLNGFLQADSVDVSMVSDKPYDFTKPVTKDLWLFAEWNQYTVGGTGENSKSYLTDYVTTLNGTGSIWNGGTGMNIAQDKGYNSYTNTVNLGYGSGTTTIPSSANVLFCMNSGDTDFGAQEGEQITDATGHKLADSYVSVDYTNTTGKANVCDYTIVLQNDLVIDGSVTIGGYTGSSSAANCFINGHIIGSYVKLDLNGYNLTINDGGVLHSFGLITDSVGTSKITVKPGGTLKTAFVIFDVHGGNNTLWGYSKGISPFYTYSLPYVECKTILHSDGSKSGSLVGFNKLSMGDLGTTNLYIRLIGGNDAYMRFSGTDGFVEIDYNEISNITNTDFASNDLELKNKFNFKNYIKFKNVLASFNPDFKVNVDVLIQKSGISIPMDVDLEFSRIDFPISTLFDIEVINSTFTLAKSIVFMPGSSFVIDKNSTLIMDYTGNRTYKQVGVNLGFLDLTLPGSTKEVLGTIKAIDMPYSNKGGFGFGMPDGLKGYTTYWSYYKEAQVNIFGRLSFTSASNTKPYVLAGNININQISYDNQNLSDMKVSAKLFDEIARAGINFRTYDMDFLSSNNYWMSASDDSLNKRVVQHQYYTRPLVCNDVAYLKDSTITNTYVGTHDYEKALFTRDNGETYFFDIGNNILVGGEDSALNLSITPVKCTYDNSMKCIVVGSDRYIYYNGFYAKLSGLNSSEYTANIQRMATISSITVKDKGTYQLASAPVKYDQTTGAWTLDSTRYTS